LTIVTPEPERPLMALPAVSLPWRIPFIFAVTFIIHHLDRNAIAYALPKIADSLGWTDQQVGDWGQYLLGAFFLTFGLSQIAFSGAAERFGAKRSMVAAILGFSCVSMAVGPLGGSLAALIALRLLLGLAESVHVPMMGVITARKFPREERATANSIWNVGLVIATALGSAIMVPIMSAYGWRNAFVIVGAAGLLIGAPLVVAFVDDRATVQAGAGERLRTFHRRPDYWLYVVIGILNAFAGFGILGWLPTYFVRAKGIDFSALGWPLSIVFTGGVVGTLLIARIGDRLNKRVLLASLGLLAASALLCLAIGARTLVPLVALFASAVFFQSAFQAQEHATVQNLARDRDVGAATGVYNGMSLVIGGVFGSMIPGAIVSATGNFNAALFVIAGVAATGGLLAGWLAIRSGELEIEGKRNAQDSPGERP
jgi:sugar phosphate permease